MLMDVEKLMMSRTGLPTVSVVVITYQHVDFIEKCIQGVLMQQTDFAVELLIGEDESSDGTRAICERYATEYPEKIKVFFRNRTEFDRRIGHSSARVNLISTFLAAKGKYIAFCEGDDHWTDPLKLQRQVDALEADPKASGCFTNAYNDKNGELQVFLGNYNRVPKGLIVDEGEFVSGLGIPSCTIVFRRELITDYPQVVQGFATGDTALFTLLLGKGHFIYQPTFTGIRVIHPGGVYSMQGAVHQLRVQLQNLPEQDKLSAYRHHGVIQLRKEYALTKAWQEALENENWLLAQLAWKHLSKDRSIMHWSVRQTILAGLRVHFPVRYERILGSLRRLRRAFTDAA